MRAALAGSVALTLSLILSAAVALAEAPRTAPIPPERPSIPATALESGGAGTDRLAVAPAPAPITRPPRAPQAPAPGALICQDPRLIGVEKANLVGHIPGCAIFEPVRLTEVAGVKLSTPATLDCRTARQFANWLTGVAQPEARRMLGARISEVWIMGSYSCRSRNNRPGARLSEHSAGRAIDIGGLVLGNGRKITVLDNWGKGTEGAYLRTLWKKACGPFTTVLGPQSDRFHQDHLHLDMAYRDRTYCR